MTSAAGIAAHEESTPTMSRWKIPRREVCWFCGRRAPSPTQAHLVPRERGGPHDEWNLVCACRPCKLTKSLLTLEEFRELVRVVLVTAGKMRSHEIVIFAGEGGPGFTIPRPPRLPPGPRPAQARVPLAPRRTMDEIPCMWCGRWMTVQAVAEHQPSCPRRPRRLRAAV
jgi:hypothetical protein